MPPSESRSNAWCEGRSGVRIRVGAMVRPPQDRGKMSSVAGYDVRPPGRMLGIAGSPLTGQAFPTDGSQNSTHIVDHPTVVQRSGQAAPELRPYSFGDRDGEYRRTQSDVDRATQGPKPLAS